MILRTCLLSLSLALTLGIAAAQTPSGPIVNGRHLQPTRQQINSREDNGASQRDRAVQSEIDHLYDEIMRAAVRRGR
jgi:hypothetical protein